MTESREAQEAGSTDWAASDVHVAFGLAVRVRRAIRGISQDTLGSVAGLHRNQISAIERGEMNPTLHTSSKIAVGLGVSMADLFGEADDRLADRVALEELRAMRLERQRQRKARTASKPAAPSAPTDEAHREGSTD